jgi:predicted nucleic acid-binding protein
LAHYLDTSALVKLVVREAESRAVTRWLGETPREPVTSDIARTELLRAVTRATPRRLEQARRVLASVTLMSITPAILLEAGRLQPSTLRTLDTIHLASALALDDDLESIVTYDTSLADAARFHGITVTAPG